MPESSAPDHDELPRLELLFQAARSTPQSLPAELGTGYGSQLDLAPDLVYANFVTSLDGVAVVGPSSGSTISGKSQADRMVMGLLRSCAEAILIGAGTLSGSPGHVWTASHVYPPMSHAFAELRRRRGLAELPQLVVVSGSGRLPLDHPGLALPALILTSRAGEAALQGVDRHHVVSLGDGPKLDPAKVLEAVHHEGHRSILCEGGPQLLGSLLERDLLDELFLTLSPLLAGRTAAAPRPGLVEGVDLLGRGRRSTPTLHTVRRAGSHLFLQYRLHG
ncbi:MAG: dihydrofolate reductase family protein [Candidatus Dormibacteria bacterium]